MPRILVAGAGALGRRHLQALTLIQEPLAVDVVDPAERSLTQAASLLENREQIEFSLHQTSDSIKEPSDIAIVATNSCDRRRCIEELLEKGIQKFVLEKVLFPRVQDYKVILERLRDANATAWVNCVRRTYPFASLLKDTFAGNQFLYKVEGGEWGMASNLVHHLDEVAFLSGRGEISCDVTELDSSLIPAKREGYFEATGTIKAHTSSRVKMVAISHRGEDARRTVTIESERAKAIIEQTEQKLTLTRDGKRSELDYPIPYQSEITAEHVTRILAGEAPDLPEYKTAAKIHESVISAMLGHFRKALDKPQLEECLIT